MVYRTDRTCEVTGCVRKHSAKGYCESHYAQVFTRGHNPATLEPFTSQREPRGQCTIDGCDSESYCRTYCIKHYQRWRKSGATDRPLTKSEVRDMVGRKRCKQCREWKPESDYTANTTGLKDGLSLRCRECQATLRERQPMRVRASALMRAYGITVADYDRMWAEQQGLCAICQRPERLVRYGKPLELSVDHCHDTGKVRGLLCHDCNTAIGKLGDDPDRINAAAEYVRGGGHAKQDGSTPQDRSQPAQRTR